MDETGIFSAAFLRLIQAHQQRCQKGHIVAQADPGQTAALNLDPAADAAVDAAVAVFFLLGQFLPAGCYIAEHIHPSFFL